MVHYTIPLGFGDSCALVDKDKEILHGCSWTDTVEVSMADFTYVVALVPSDGTVHLPAGSIALSLKIETEGVTHLVAKERLLYTISDPIVAAYVSGGLKRSIESGALDYHLPAKGTEIDVE